MQLINKIKDYLQGKPSAKRSPQWPALRKAHLDKYPTCSVCGGSKKLEVHHVFPFHIRPELELEPTNLITLCEESKYGKNCHLWFGHLGDYKGANLMVPLDAIKWKQKFQERFKYTIK